MIAKALILVVFCVEAIRFDNHADELSEISALIKQFKKPAQKKSQNNVVTVVPKQFKPAQNTTHFDTTTLDVDVDVDVDVGPILSKVDVDSVSSGGVEEEKVGQLTQIAESTEVAGGYQNLGDWQCADNPNPVESADTACPSSCGLGISSQWNPTGGNTAIQLTIAECEAVCDALGDACVGFFDRDNSGLGAAGRCLFFNSGCNPSPTGTYYPNGKFPYYAKAKAEPSDCIICENWEDPSVLGTKWFLKKYAPNFGNSYQNSASTAQIIDDPTGEGKGKVLTFTGEVHYGDTFSVKDIGPDCQSETCVWEIEMKGNNYLGGYADQLPNHPSEHGHQWPYSKSSPSDWVKFTQEFTSPYGETHLMFEMMGPGPLYIDNLKVYKKSDGDCKCPTENKPVPSSTEQILLSLNGQTLPSPLTADQVSKIKAAEGKLILAWSTVSTPTDVNNWKSFEKAVSFVVPDAPSITGAYRGPGGTQCSNTDNFAPVAVTCLKGDCNMPTTMYTGTKFQTICYGKAYGLVTNLPQNNAQCDWTMDGQQFRSVYIGESACHGIKDESNAEWKDTSVKAISLFAGSPDHGDMHNTIKELLGDIKKSITEEKSAATKAALGECTTSVDENLQLETEVDFTSTTKLEGDATQYTDLVGCSSESDCEKDTDEEQKKAINAHAEIIRLEGELDEWEGDKATGQINLKDNKDRKDALLLKNTTHQALHETRMGKFAQAIKILKRIDDALEADSGNQATGKISEVAPASLVSQEEKKIIREVSTVGNAILMMVDQATTVGGDNQQGLVQTLKNLLKTCISKLDGSMNREILAQEKWIEAINAKIKGLDTEIGRIGGVITDLTSKIAENKRLIGEEETKKADAITESDTLRDSCVTRHNLFKADMHDFTRELDAIKTMLEILEEAKLDAKTVEIRDEDENTKHGVMESIGGTDVTTEAPAPATTQAPGYSYTKHADKACSGRNEVGVIKETSREDCRAKCDVASACISFEWMDTVQWPGHCQLSSSCTAQLATIYQEHELYIKGLANE